MKSRLADCLHSFRAMPRWVQLWMACVLVPVNLMPFLLVLLTYFVVLGAAAFALKWMQA